MDALSYSSRVAVLYIFAWKILKKEEVVFTRDRPSTVYLCGSLIMASVFIMLYLEHSPPLYHAYFAMTVFLWTNIFSEYRFLRALWRHFLQGKESYHVIELSATSVVSIIILECLVRSFTERVIYSWCFLIVGVISPLYLVKSIPWKSGIPVFLWLACWFLSVFTLLPAEIPDNTVLVCISGIIIVVIGVGSRYLDMHTRDNKYWLYLIICDSKPKFPMLFQLQALLVGLSSILVYLSTSHRTKKRELLALHQMMNWSIAGFSMVLPLFSATGLLSRLTSIYLGFAPPFLLLSIGRILFLKVPDTRKGLLLSEIERVSQDYKVHRDEIHTKLVQIMRERLLLHSRELPQIIETWYRADETDLQPSQFAKSITKEVGNVPYVVENGCGKFSKSPKEIATIVSQWFGPILYSKSFKIFTSLSNKDV